MSRMLCLLCLLCTSLTGSETEDLQSDFNELVARHTYAIKFSENTVSGPGIDWLNSEGAKAQYFLIGERHGLAEIPLITSAIFKGLSKVGYQHVALEHSPFAARLLEQQLKKGGYRALRDYLTHPEGFDSIAFMSWEEEVRMAADLYAMSHNKDNFFIGLDQEFLFTFKAHLNFLKSYATSENQQNAIAQMQQALTHNAYLFAALSPAEMQDFTALFRSVDNAIVQKLLDDMVLSNQIYGPWATPPRLPRAESNVIRENLMKDNFIDWVNQSGQSDGKVLFKFGGFHAAPNVDLTYGRITLGTFIESYARINGQTAFNLFIECYSGIRKSSGQDKDNQTDQSRACQSGLGHISNSSLSQEHHPFSNALLSQSDEIILIDLRSIRKRLNEFTFLSRASKAIIAGFDAYMGIPNTNPATSLTVAESFR